MPEYLEIRGESHQEAFQKVRERFGKEVVILDHGPIPHRDFLKRMIGKKEYFVRVAIPKKKKEVKKDLPLEESLKALKELREKIQGDKSSSSSSLPIQKRWDSPSSSLEKKILQELEKIQEKIDSLSFSSQEKIFLEPPFQNLYAFLEKQFFSFSWLEDFFNELKKRLPKADWAFPYKVLEGAKRLLEDWTLVNPYISGKRVFIFLGPTGVGKTTTIAKLASRYALKENKKVALLTLDQYRIAAQEHLLGFAEILQIPLVTAKTPESFLEKLENLPAEIILVDTPGYSPTNEEFLNIQKKFFSSLPQNVDKVLVLSATTKREDVEFCIEKFSLLGLQRSILTKIDETSYFGFFIELTKKWNLPFFAFCDGQNVPNSLHEAKEGFIVERLFSAYK